MRSTHIHHIVPKHMGGTNDPSNLEKLTIEDHAKKHLELYEQYGLWQDKLAWQTLSGQITHAAAIKEAQRRANIGDGNPMRRSIAAKAKQIASLTGRKLDPKHAAKVRKTLVPGGRIDDICRKRMSESHKGWTNNPKGGIPPNHKGKRWITNGISCKFFPKEQPLPEGWREGMK